MDKSHNALGWTKTITIHIKNDMCLMFYILFYISHLWCDNQDYKYQNHIHHTSPENETEWDGSTLCYFLQDVCLLIGSFI